MGVWVILIRESAVRNLNSDIMGLPRNLPTTAVIVVGNIIHGGRRSRYQYLPVTSNDDGNILLYNPFLALFATHSGSQGLEFTR